LKFLTNGLTRILFFALWVVLLASAPGWAQTDCADGNGVLERTPPKAITVQELIHKFAAQESKVKEARNHYSYTQDVLVQTLNGKAVDGEFHEVATVSYDNRGRRDENVTFAEQSTLRRVQLSAEDMNDIRWFMPFLLPTEDLPQYKLTYTGQQQVDDLQTSVFYVEPAKEEQNKRYFQGRIWVDNRDLQIVKLCGKSVPDQIRTKKNQLQDIRPMFVGYRQLVDGFWFPAYARVDETLHFRAAEVHIREIVKLNNYKRTDAAVARQ
jgi:hypothetical protein